MFWVSAFGVAKPYNLPHNHTHSTSFPFHSKIKQLRGTSPSTKHRTIGASASHYTRHSNTPSETDSRPNTTSVLHLQTRGSGGRGSHHSQNRNQNAGTNGDRSPPLLQREPPINYQEKMNLHQDYMGRNGHLKVTKGIPSR